MLNTVIKLDQDQLQQQLAYAVSVESADLQLMCTVTGLLFEMFVICNCIGTDLAA